MNTERLKCIAYKVYEINKNIVYGVSLLSDGNSKFKKSARVTISANYISANREIYSISEIDDIHKDVIVSILRSLKTYFKLLNKEKPLKVKGYTSLTHIYLAISDVKRYAKNKGISLDNDPICNCCNEEIIDTPIKDRWDIGYICSKCNSQEIKIIYV